MKEISNIRLPEPSRGKCGSEFENGYFTWEYPTGEVSVFDDGTFELNGKHYTDTSILRSAAAAFLAASEMSETLFPQKHR